MKPVWGVKTWTNGIAIRNFVDLIVILIHNTFKNIRIAMSETKICSRCKEEKPIIEFYSRNRSPDGKQNHCKECHKKYATENRVNGDLSAKRWRDNNKERVSVRDKEYKSTKKEHLAKLDEHWRKRNPLKLRSGNCKRRLQYLKSIPKWYEQEHVELLYSKRDELNKIWNLRLEVDHIIPLISDTVCGLHCWHNLQLLDKSLNCSKSTNYQQDW